MALPPRVVREGVIGGMVGAAVVAVWFLILDAVRGRPFRTPAVLGAAALQGVTDPGAVTTSPALVIQYTVLHGVVFAMVGVLLAYLIASAQTRPSRLLVLFIGLLCFEVSSLALIVWLVHPVLTEVASWTIFVANLLAAAGMLVYFFVGHRVLARALLGPWTAVAREGLIAGLLGAVTVAGWFLLYDLAAGRPLRSPALLGAVLFDGLRDINALTITVPAVLKYTAVHGAAFVAFGWAAAGLLALADREPRLLYAFVMLFCCFEVFFVGMVAALAEWLLEALAWWTILMGNLLSAVAMLAFFFRKHRLAWRVFRAARD
jgi:hypothetical protein